jgi:predicted CopG family antitoxin
MANRDITIRVSRENWQRLRDRKEEPGTSFDDVISDLLDTVEGLEGAEED